MLRRWIAEGRLTSDSWVWREGWADWQPAAQVLSMHFAPAPAPAAYAPQMGPLGGGIADALQEPSPLARPHAPRRRGNDNTIVIVTVALAVFLMLASLGFVYYWVNYLSD